MKTFGTFIIIEGSRSRARNLSDRRRHQHRRAQSLLQCTRPSQFPKSNTVELRHIVDEFERVALAHSAGVLQSAANGVELFHLNKANLRQRIIHLFGNNYNEKLVPIEEQTSVTRLSGFIGKPDSARKQGETVLLRQQSLHPQSLSAACRHQCLRPDAARRSLSIIRHFHRDRSCPHRCERASHQAGDQVRRRTHRLYFHPGMARHALAQYSIAPTLDFDQDPTFASICRHSSIPTRKKQR